MSKQIKDTKVSDIQILENGSPVGPLQENCVDIDSRNLGDRQNEPITPTGATDGVVTTLPVVLAELAVRFFVSATIDLPEPALEIKDVKKKLKVTQCMLLQPTNILFVRGFVRKNIDYSTGTCSNVDGVCGEIHHCTVDVPFEFTTPINYFRQPDEIINTTRSEFEYLKEQDLPREDFAEKDMLMSSDFSEFNQTTEEYLNKLPFCELISSSITEFDEYINRARPVGINLPFEEGLFTEIEEKMVIQLRIKLLQDQSVVIPAVDITE